MRLDNFKIRTKLIIIYIICVLLPMIVTNLFLVQMVTRNVREEEYRNMENIRDQVINELQIKINNVTAISDYLYMNERLNAFIEGDYPSPVAYYEAFDRFIEDSIIRYYYTTESVYNIQICTDNPGIISGSYFCSRDEVKDTDWYRKYLQNEEKISILAYYEKDSAYEQAQNRARHISLIRKMDNFGGSAVMRIDFDYEILAGILDYEMSEVELYLLDQEKIILQSGEKEIGAEDYPPRDSLQKKKLTVEGDLEIMGEKWELILEKDNYSISEALKGQRGSFAFLILINLILPSVLIVVVDKSFKKRIMLAESYIKKAEQEQFEIIPGDHGRDEVGSLIRSFNLMVVKIRKLIEVVYKKDAEQKDMMIARNRAELEGLKRQINPHFMYNTLESIRMHSLVKGEKETAEQMGRFAFLLREVTYWPDDFVKAEEEAAAVDVYLGIQKNRFGRRLDYTVYIQEETKNLRIPKFSVLTFVENACIHGIEPKLSGGSISVSITSDENDVYLEVIDSGKGMDDEKLEKLRGQIRDAALEKLENAKSIGVMNTVVRLKMYFHDDMEFEIDSKKDEGTELFIKIPRVEGKDGDRYVKGNAGR